MFAPGVRCDGHDRLIATIHPDASRDTRRYDAGGRLTELGTRVGDRISAGFDPLDRLVAIEAPRRRAIARCRYDPLHRRIRVELGNGAETEYRHALDGELIEITHRLSGETVRLACAYDRAGQPISLEASPEAYLWRPTRGGEPDFEANALDQHIAAGGHGLSDDPNGPQLLSLITLFVGCRLLFSERIRASCKLVSRVPALGNSCCPMGKRVTQPVLRGGLWNDPLSM